MPWKNHAGFSTAWKTFFHTVENPEQAIRQHSCPLPPLNSCLPGFPVFLLRLRLFFPVFDIVPGPRPAYIQNRKVEVVHS
jgi:hypothetical protein